MGIIQGRKHFQARRRGRKRIPGREPDPHFVQIGVYGLSSLQAFNTTAPIDEGVLVRWSARRRVDLQRP